MFSKNLLVSAIIAAGTAIGTAMPLPGYAAVDIELNFGPPPQRVEVVPAPRHGYVWAPGYWDWRGKKHVWVKGHWFAERRGYAYQPHRWVEHEGRWSLERGHWDRARHDSDRDGVPDRSDRHPNNPHRS